VGKGDDGAIAVAPILVEELGSIAEFEVWHDDLVDGG
jgi:hypothetical protein